eukprot:Em0009g244a
MEVPDLVVGNELVWKTSKGTSYDVKLLRVHDKKPTDGGEVKEARVRQEEDSPPSSSEDGSHQDYITTTDKPDQSQKDATSVEDSSNHSLTVRKKTTTDKPDKAQKGARSVEDDGDHHSNVRKKTSTDQPDQAQKSNTLSFGSLESEDESPVRKKRRDVHDSEMTDFSAAFQNLKHLSTMNETLKEIRDMMKAVMDSKTNSSESLQPRNANAEANEQMDHFLTGLDLIHHHLKTLYTLVYQCNCNSTVTLSQVESMSDHEKLHRMTKEVVSQPQVPQGKAIIRDFGDMMSLALKCVYSCERCEQLDAADRILECLPMGTTGLPEELLVLHKDIDKLEDHLRQQCLIPMDAHLNLGKYLYEETPVWKKYHLRNILVIYALSVDRPQSRQADILHVVMDWNTRRPAAFDISRLWKRRISYIPFLLTGQIVMTYGIVSVCIVICTRQCHAHQGPAYVQKGENDICDDGKEIAEAEDWESTVKENRSSLHPCLIHPISLHNFSTVISSPSVNNTLDSYQRVWGPSIGTILLRHRLQEQGEPSLPVFIRQRVSENRIGIALQAVHPDYHRIRLNGASRILNPQPYRAAYFGEKLHNEKLVMFGVTHICAIDGYSGKIVQFVSMPVKNPVQIYQHLFRPILVNYGLFDQIRVDHSKEWTLSLFVQESLAHLRHSVQKPPHRQTSSTLWE